MASPGPLAHSLLPQQQKPSDFCSLRKDDTEIARTPPGGQVWKHIPPKALRESHLGFARSPLKGVPGRTVMPTGLRKWGAVTLMWKGKKVMKIGTREGKGKVWERTEPKEEKEGCIENQRNTWTRTPSCLQRYKQGNKNQQVQGQSHDR